MTILLIAVLALAGYWYLRGRPQQVAHTAPAPVALAPAATPTTTGGGAPAPAPVASQSAASASGGAPAPAPVAGPSAASASSGKTVSGGGAGTGGGTAEIEPPPAPPGDTPRVEREAKHYIQNLTRTEPDAVPVQHADNFVRPDQMLSLAPPGPTEKTTLEALRKSPSIKPNTPITVVHTVQQVEMDTPERLIAQSQGDLDKKIRVVGKDNTIHEETVRQALAEHEKTPQKAIPVVRNTHYYEITTPAKLAKDKSITPTTTIEVIRKPYATESATVRELLEANHQKVDSRSVFYLRTVRVTDIDGIWGIVRDGLVDNFARGMAIRRGEAVDTYRIDIPRHADALLPDQSSSFLGKLIWEKSFESHVYNYRLHRMGENPNRIYPGQEIVIIRFSPNELLSIYKHFLDHQG